MEQTNIFHKNYQKISQLLSFDLVIDKGSTVKRGEEELDIRALYYEIVAKSRAISAIPILTAWQEEIQYDELIRGVGGTIRIEGNTLTDEEIRKLFAEKEKGSDLTLLHKEAINSRAVYAFCIDWVENNPDGQITVPVISQIHEITTQNIDYPGNTPGKFRMGQLKIGYPPRPTLLNHDFDISEYMQQFVEWLNNPALPEGWPPNIINLIKPVLAHYYFTEIHPFGNGNGRTARALEALMLYKGTGFNRFGFYAMANYCYREREKYIDLLGKVYTNLDITDFILFNLEALSDSLAHVYEAITTKIYHMVYRDFLRESMERGRIKANEFVIVQILIKQGSMRRDELLKNDLFKVSYTTRYRYLKNLEKQQLIQIVPDPDNPKKKIVKPNYGVVHRIALAIR